MTTRRRPLYDRITAAFLWLAAFSYSAGIFLSLNVALRNLPPTKPLAVGLVTILRYSKARDYAGAALFFALVAPLAVALHALGSRLIAREQQRMHARRRDAEVATAFALPFLVAPFLLLTSGKIGWTLVLPPALAYAAILLLRVWDGSSWVRRPFRADLRPYHALLFCGAFSWLVFRYLATGKRIAHSPTLLLEIVFALVLLALFWGAALLLALLIELQFGTDPAESFRRIATGAAVITLLPVVAFVQVPTRGAAMATAAAFLLAALIAWAARPLSPRAAWLLAAYALMPLIVYFVSYGSSAAGSQWIDLFHRGESLGPASDYLRGKAPYRGVFALHGMLEDGLLDAWLMQLFGRSVTVTLLRSDVLAGLLLASLWYLGVIVFESIPLASIVVVMGAWTTAENDRTFFQIASAALFWLALRRRSRVAALASGAFAGVALFFSYEIGTYTIAGALAAALLVAIGSSRAPWEGLAPLRAAGWFMAGVLLGGAPFVAYLAVRGSLAAFATTSFVVIPRIIDAVWSMPFPDLASTFRADNLNIHTLAEFVLYEKFHLILSPLVIAVALTYLVQRFVRRRAGDFDYALLVLTVFATFAQRTALGRAEFRHQYFAAFLIGPIIVLLAVAALRGGRDIWRSGDEGHRAFAVLLAVALLPFAAILFWIPDLVNIRLGDLVNYQRRYLHTQYDARAAEGNDRIAAVSDYIRSQTKRNEPIFDFSNQPAFYFFADRPNPTRFYQVPIASPRELQAEAIRALEASKPRVVLRTSPEGFDEFDGVPNALRAQAIAAYLDDCYEFDRDVRGVELWKRKNGAKPKPVAAYLRRIQLPGPESLVSSPRERMVFPLVGSSEGVGGAYWVSDLTLHNATRTPMPVSLRFIGGDRRVDRNVVLAPRQTARWADVVRTLFGIDRGIGALWIIGRAGRQPVAIVRSSDVVHAGRTIVEKPLTRSDVAASGGDNAELTLAGIPGTAAGPRNVSIGIVNTGYAPAHYRITVRDGRGVVAGRPVEMIVAEDEVQIVSNPEHELGVPLDESSTVRISIVNGTGVAFASVTDVNGGLSFIPASPSQPQ